MADCRCGSLASAAAPATVQALMPPVPLPADAPPSLAATAALAAEYAALLQRWEAREAALRAAADEKAALRRQLAAAQGEAANLQELAGYALHALAAAGIAAGIEASTRPAEAARDIVAAAVPLLPLLRGEVAQALREEVAGLRQKLARRDESEAAAAARAADAAADAAASASGLRGELHRLAGQLETAIAARAAMAAQRDRAVSGARRIAADADSAVTELQGQLRLRDAALEAASAAIELRDRHIAGMRQQLAWAEEAVSTLRQQVQERDAELANLAALVEDWRGATQRPAASKLSAPPGPSSLPPFNSVAARHDPATALDVTRLQHRIGELEVTALAMERTLTNLMAETATASSTVPSRNMTVAAAVTSHTDGGCIAGDVSMTSDGHATVTRATLDALHGTIDELKSQLHSERAAFEGRLQQRERIVELLAQTGGRSGAGISGGGMSAPPAAVACVLDRLDASLSSIGSADSDADAPFDNSDAALTVHTLALNEAGVGLGDVEALAGDAGWSQLQLATVPSGSGGTGDAPALSVGDVSTAERFEVAGKARGCDDAQGADWITLALADV